MATNAQVTFFDQCLDEREFPAGQDATALRAQFAELSKDAASNWIDKALTLPKKGAGAGTNTPPPF